MKYCTFLILFLIFLTISRNILLGIFCDPIYYVSNGVYVVKGHDSKPKRCSTCVTAKIENNDFVVKKAFCGNNECQGKNSNKKRMTLNDFNKKYFSTYKVYLDIELISKYGRNTYEVKYTCSR